LLTAALVIACAALAALVLVLATLLFTRRSTRRRDTLAGSAGADIAGRTEANGRTEARIADLERALARAQEEQRRSRAYFDLARTTELDQVLERTLEATRALGGADAALVTIPAAAEDRPLIATLGLSAEEAERQGIVGGPPDGRISRAVSVGYVYTDEQRAREPGLLHAGVAVPLSGGDAVVGHIAVFTRDPARAFGDDEVRELEELARHATPAVENALRLREAQKLADLDALTGLHNQRFFHATLEREVARAQRYGRKLSLLVIDLDDFKDVNARVGHLGGDDVLADVAERVRSVVRTTDIACRVGGDEFALVLPESTLEEADSFYRRIRNAVSTTPVAGAGKVQLSVGVAELRPQDDARSFFERADEALYRAKSSGKGMIKAEAGRPES
jgi:two-component system, cell cycle response regulator